MRLRNQLCCFAVIVQGMCSAAFADSPFATVSMMVAQGSTGIVAEVLDVPASTFRANHTIESGTVTLRVNKVVAGKQLRSGDTITIPFVRSLGVQGNPENWEVIAPNFLPLKETVLDHQFVFYIAGGGSQPFTLFPSSDAVQQTAPTAVVGTVLSFGGAGMDRTVTLHIDDVVGGASASRTVVLRYPSSVASAPASPSQTDPVVGDQVFAVYRGSALESLQAATAQKLAALRLVESTVIVQVYDVNGDGFVNCADLSATNSVLGGHVGEPGYNRAADVNNDGTVNTQDLIAVAQHISVGLHCSGH